MLQKTWTARHFLRALGPLFGPPHGMAAQGAEGLGGDVNKNPPDFLMFFFPPGFFEMKFTSRFDVNFFDGVNVMVPPDLMTGLSGLFILCL